MVSVIRGGTGGAGKGWGGESKCNVKVTVLFYLVLLWRLMYEEKDTGHRIGKPSSCGLCLGRVQSGTHKLALGLYVFIGPSNFVIWKLICWKRNVSKVTKTWEDGSRIRVKFDKNLITSLSDDDVSYSGLVTVFFWPISTRTKVGPRHPIEILKSSFKQELNLMAFWDCFYCFNPSSFTCSLYVF